LFQKKIAEEKPIADIGLEPESDGKDDLKKYVLKSPLAGFVFSSPESTIADESIDMAAFFNYAVTLYIIFPCNKIC
jgi:hypothetical protein